MLDKLSQIHRRYEEIEMRLGDPGLVNDRNAYRDTMREQRQLRPIEDAYHAYAKLLSDLEGARELMETSTDPELHEMAESEYAELRVRKETMEEEIRFLLIPQDPDDSKNCIVEIRAGTGGEEAALFAGDLYRMYTRYAEKKGWRVEPLDFSESEMGGYKEVSFMLSGEDVFGSMKFESGVHRVQRVPETEQQGRVHTSAASMISGGMVVSPERKINTLMPKCAQIATMITATRANRLSPSQSTDGTPNSPSNWFRVPSNRMMMLNIVPVMMELSTMGKK